MMTIFTITSVAALDSALSLKAQGMMLHDSLIITLDMSCLVQLAETTMEERVG